MILEKICPKDIIAIAVIISGFILLGFGINSVVGGILVMVTTYYFATHDVK